MVTIRCKKCNKEFEVSSRRADKAKYCSYECNYADKPAKFITAECGFCGKQFERPFTTKTQNYKRLFCSQTCYHQAKTAEKQKKFCKQCNQPITNQNQVYCSQACQVQAGHTEKVCPQCGKNFVVKSSLGDQKYCSYDCIHAAQNSDIEFVCSVCGKKFVAKRWTRSKCKQVFCSPECARQRSPKQLCKCECGKEFFASPSRMKYANKLYCSNECRLKYSNTTLIYFGHIDDKYEEVSRKIRGTAKYKKWAQSCRIRDNKCCVRCGSPDGITVHHIKPMWKFLDKHNFDIEQILNDPELMDPSIGITLCRSCHKKEHQYKGGNNG